jgi:hypothetical protein
MYKRQTGLTTKKSCPDDPYGLTKHHRKPQHLKGTDAPRNISYPPRYKHAAWHALYEDLPAADIISLFLIDYELMGMDVKKSQLTAELHGKHINRDGPRIKRRDNWRILFDNRMIEEIVREVNTMWLDPDFELVIKIARVLSIEMSVSKKK